MKRIKIDAIISYIFGLLLLSLGIVLVVKAIYGVTVLRSTAYMLNKKFAEIPFGVFNYIIQGIIFIIMCIAMKSMKLKYFLSFLSTVILGYVIDLFNFLLRNFNLDSHFSRVALYILAMIVIGMEITFFMKSRLPIMPFDLFVKEVSAKYKISIGKFKSVYDISLLVTAISLSFGFFGKLNGIGVGTFISTEPAHV